MWKITVNLFKSRVKIIAMEKHPLGSRFHKVAVIEKLLLEWKLRLTNGFQKKKKKNDVRYIAHGMTGPSSTSFKEFPLEIMTGQREAC